MVLVCALEESLVRGGIDNTLSLSHGLRVCASFFPHLENFDIGGIVGIFSNVVKSVKTIP